MLPTMVIQATLIMVVIQATLTSDPMDNTGRGETGDTVLIWRVTDQKRTVTWHDRAALLTFGRHDWLVIGEFPDDRACASAVLAAAAGGSLSDIETTPAMTAKDAYATFVSAGKAAKTFRSAGDA